MVLVMGGIVLTQPEHSPRLQGEHQDIMPGTPLAVLGVWLAALRYRFNDNQGEPLPWVYNSDLRPEDDENAQPRNEEEGEPRKLLIEAAFHTEKEVRNYRPAIYVDRGTITPMKHHVDNFVGKYIPTGYKAYHAMANMPITFLVDSESAGECSLIADTAWFFVLATRDIFRKDFGFHEISNPTMGPTQPQPAQDKTVWQTSIEFNVQFDLRWTTKPVAPFLRDINLAINKSSDAQLVYHEIALRESLR